MDSEDSDNNNNNNNNKEVVNNPHLPREDNNNNNNQIWVDLAVLVDLVDSEVSEEWEDSRFKTQKLHTLTKNNNYNLWDSQINQLTSRFSSKPWVMLRQQLRDSLICLIDRVSKKKKIDLIQDVSNE